MNFVKKQTMILSVILLGISCALFLSCKMDEGQNGQKAQSETQEKTQIEKPDDEYGIKILIVNNSEKSFFLSKLDLEIGTCDVEKNGNIKEIYFPFSLDFGNMISGWPGYIDLEVPSHEYLYFYSKMKKMYALKFSDMFFKYYYNDKTDEYYSVFEGFAEEVKYYFYVSPEKYSYGNIMQYADYLKDNGIRLEGKFIGDTLVFAIR